MSAATRQAQEQAPDSRSLAILNGWARGCGHCTFGLIDPATPTLPIPLYILRAFDYQFGMLAVCECRAGVEYVKLLTRIWQRIRDDDEHIPSTWATAIHTDITRRLQPPAMPAHAAAEAVRA